MHRLFHRLGRKDNVKVLRRELALAHTCIALLSIGMIAILTTFYDQVGDFNRGLIIVVDALLILVTFISVSIVGYIIKTKK